MRRIRIYRSVQMRTEYPNAHECNTDITEDVEKGYTHRSEIMTKMGNHKNRGILICIPLSREIRISWNEEGVGISAEMVSIVS